MVHGVLVIDKPRGITSHDAVNRARRLLRQRRIGHAGTLDPIATGVLVLLLGKATRLSRFLTAGEKSYRGVVRLGFATDTDDTEGSPLHPPRPISFDEEQLREAARRLTGRIHQLPPLYSAKKLHGEPAYTRARRDQPVVREVQEVEIYSMKVARLGPDRLEFETRCAAGTYARAIARDLGESLGCGGHLEGLVRTGSGVFRLEDAHKMDELPDGEAALAAVIAFADIPLPFPDVVVSGDEADRIANGMHVSAAGRVEPVKGAPPEWIRIRNPSGDFVALASLEGPFLRPRVVFPE